MSREIKIIAHSRNMGKSTFKMYLDELADTLPPAYIDKTYTSSSTKEVRHILYVNDEVLQWLKDEHNQFSIKNPE